MPSGKELLEKKSTAGNILHGSDVPKAQYKGFKVKIKKFRPADENFNAVGVLDIEPIFEGKESIAVNKTNMRALIEKLGDNTDKWAGKTVEFIVIFTRNPKTGKNVPSLGIAE